LINEKGALFIENEVLLHTKEVLIDTKETFINAKEALLNARKALTNESLLKKKKKILIKEIIAIHLNEISSMHRWTGSSEYSLHIRKYPQLTKRFHSSDDVSVVDLYYRHISKKPTNNDDYYYKAFRLLRLKISLLGLLNNENVSEILKGMNKANFLK
jgi:hypothetical protein